MSCDRVDKLTPLRARSLVLTLMLPACPGPVVSAVNCPRLVELALRLLIVIDSGAIKIKSPPGPDPEVDTEISPSPLPLKSMASVGLSLLG